MTFPSTGMAWSSRTSLAYLTLLMQMAVQADGKVILEGTMDGGSQDQNFVVARYNFDRVTGNPRSPDLRQACAGSSADHRSDHGGIHVGGRRHAND